MILIGIIVFLTATSVFLFNMLITPLTIYVCDFADPTFFFFIFTIFIISQSILEFVNVLEHDLQQRMTIACFAGTMSALPSQGSTASMTSASASKISPNDRRLSPRDATFPLQNKVKGRLSRGVIFVYCGFLPESITCSSVTTLTMPS